MQIKKLTQSSCHFIFVSDEAKDLMQANEAGFSSIGVSWGFDTTESLQKANPKTIISKPVDIIPILFDNAQSNKIERELF